MLSNYVTMLQHFGEIKGNKVVTSALARCVECFNRDFRLALVTCLKYNVLLQEASLRLASLSDDNEEEGPSIYDLGRSPPPQGNSLGLMAGWSSGDPFDENHARMLNEHLYVYIKNITLHDCRSF